MVAQMTTKSSVGPGCPCSLASDLSFQILKQLFGAKILIFLSFPAIFLITVLSHLGVHVKIVLCNHYLLCSNPQTASAMGPEVICAGILEEGMQCEGCREGSPALKT